MPTITVRQPSNAFPLFLVHERKRLLANGEVPTDLSHVKQSGWIMKKAAEAWKAMSDAEKAVSFILLFSSENDLESQFVSFSISSPTSTRPRRRGQHTIKSAALQLTLMSSSK